MTVTSAWIVTTARLRMTPVGHWDLADLVRLKSDPRSFALMLGGVKAPVEAASELAQDICDWGRYGYGMWAVRAQRGKFLGMTALMRRADGRGVALRFAFLPDVRGVGLASEAAGAALNYGHGAAGLKRIVAVAREENFASRAILGSIGMSHYGEFRRDGSLMYVYQSIR
ncbi:GNAT family N-acetyltransferase [Acidocella sp.]|uniref:GNAT family N-acetyltransferase n=1 Tax=Acidocella sp. TaxID=50710 RepID=UPI00262DAFA5|nr:GNAT family N-acetyltransferase [Acidocella sp.]